MDTVALWVAGLPGAVGHVTSFGTAPLLLATAGLLLIALLKTPLRWSGAIFVLAAIVCAARAPVPKTTCVARVCSSQDVHVSAADRLAAAEGMPVKPQDRAICKIE